MKRICILIPTLLTCWSAGSVAHAEVNTPAPEATFLFGSDMFKNGQSNNMGPALSQVLDLYWRSGDCSSSDQYAKCDAIRFGMSVFAPGSCAPTINTLVAPQEDGGGHVGARVSTIHNEGGGSWCGNMAFRPHDDALRAHHAFTFPGGSGVTELELDAFWERPRLTLMFVGDLPQTSNTRDDDRLIETIRGACENFDGDAGVLPSMPTWTFATRRFNQDAVPYAGLIAAAGGTGSCCYGNNCNPQVVPIDVCAHVEDGRTDAQIRRDIQAGQYTCGSNGTSYGTGAIDFGTSDVGTLPEIRCHLVGSDNNDNCAFSNRHPTDILGIFSCVRQLPRGVLASDINFMFCPPAGGPCVDLADAGGMIEWIDDARTLFYVDGLSDCSGVTISTCEPNVPCIVEGAEGRCALGRIDCSTSHEVCVGMDPMPEICNGLDDDCDGDVDNISASWSRPDFDALSLPPEHAGLHCNLMDACICANGTDTHAGGTFGEYLDAWSPVCTCGESLAMSVGEPTVSGAEEADGSAACATTSMRSRPAFALMLLAVILGMIVRRRW